MSGRSPATETTRVLCSGAQLLTRASKTAVSHVSPKDTGSADLLFIALSPIFLLLRAINRYLTPTQIKNSAESTLEPAAFTWHVIEVVAGLKHSMTGGTAFAAYAVATHVGVEAKVPGAKLTM